MANATVVDELIVTLALDAEPYQQVEKKVERETARTFRKQQDRARATDRVGRDQQKRLKDVAKGVSAFATTVMGAVTAVAGLATTVGVALTGILSFETGLRRQAVGTGLSNRQMQAWSGTARRLGADAQAGAEAMAALAKERQQFELTGNAPTMQALARFGVNVNRGRSLEDIIGDAQRLYRAAPEGQKQQFENVLAAQGVSADLILMIKSEIDARDAYAKSFTQATEENRQAADRLADTLETLKSGSIKVAANLLDILAPAIDASAKFLDVLAVDLDQFSKDLRDAGGGIDGFQQTLDKNFPTMGRLFEGFRLLGDVVEGAWQGLKNFVNWLPTGGRTVQNFLNQARAPWSSQPLGDAIMGAGTRAHRAVFGAKGENGALARGVMAADDWLRAATAAPGAAGGAALPTPIPDSALARPGSRGGAGGAGRGRSGATGRAQEIMTILTSQYGLSVAQAAAVVANWQAESGLKTDAFNPAGGGAGARGLAQWRGARSRAFKARFGVMPDQGELMQQIDFAMTDPYERSLMMRSFARGGNAEQLGRSYSEIFEAHGNVREDARRGQRAGQLAGTPTSEINIQNMTVQSNDPTAFVGGLQRIDATQPYNTVVR